MKERGVHAVDVIKSRSGVTVYSAIHDKNGEVLREKEPQTRPSFGELQEDYSRELQISQSFDNIYLGAAYLSGFLEAYLAVKTVIDLINKTNSEIPRDALGVVVLFGLLATSFLASSLQQENIKQTSDEMEALEIAQEIRSAHFRREFPH